MAVTIARLASEVNANATKDAERLQEQIDAATEIVTKLATGATVPDSIRDRATLEAAADLWRRNKARTGMPAMDDYMGNPEPVHSLRDPNTSARIVLQPWLTPAIG